MKFKATLWILALLITWALCSCSTRKKETELTKEKSSHSSDLKIDLNEDLIDKSTFESWVKDHSQSIKVIEYYHIDPSGKLPYKRETEIYKADKSEVKKEFKDLTQNKALQATEKKNDTSSRILKNKQTEKAGVSTGKVLGVSLILIVTLAALYLIKGQIKSFN